MDTVDDAFVTTSVRRGTDCPAIGYGIRSERRSGGFFVVSLAGEHDLYSAPEVLEALRTGIATGATTTVVDLSETTFLDSTILQVLLTVRKELSDVGPLCLVTTDEKVKKVFEIAGVDRFFEFYPSRRTAEEQGVRST